MDYNKTHFHFLEEDCINEFGNENGKKIYDLSCTRLSSTLEKADYRKNDIIKEHYWNMVIQEKLHIIIH